MAPVQIPAVHLKRANYHAKLKSDLQEVLVCLYATRNAKLSLPWSMLF